jgi:peptidoglycan/xylan/chitin deacetylase (PgdA/CDA1 family)
VLERLVRERADVLPVLTYHRVDVVGRAPLLYPGLISAEPDGFEEQMRFLAARWRPLSLAELLAVRRGVTRLPRRSILVTFDDAYRDFGEIAWPILARHEIPVTLFVPTAYPADQGRAFWWDRLSAAVITAREEALSSVLGRFGLATDVDRLGAFRHLRNHLKRLRHDEMVGIVDELCAALDAPSLGSSVLTWHELRALHDEGVAMAPHSRTHALLNRLAVEDARAEITGSLDDLKREIGEAPRVLAYPAGGYGPSVERLLREERFELAFSTEGGTNDLRKAEWLCLRRISVLRESGLPLLRARLLPWWPSQIRKPLVEQPREAATPSVSVEGAGFRARERVGGSAAWVRRGSYIRERSGE